MVALAPSLNSSARQAPRRLGQSARFLQLLPLIRRIARYAFRGMSCDEREEAMQEVVANCFVMYARLFERGKEAVAYASPLARYGIAQYRAGRRVGSTLNRGDLTSAYCQRHNEVVLESLFRQDEVGHWEELVVQDKRSTPADVAAIRLDFRAWLRRLGSRKRNAARLLASGAATGEAAKRLRITPARVSQLRRELSEDWAAFQGEPLVHAA